MKKWIKGILYGNLYFGIISSVVLISLIVLTYGVYLNNLLFMLVGGCSVILITLFQSMVIREYIIYKKYGV